MVVFYQKLFVAACVCLTYIECRFLADTCDETKLKACTSAVLQDLNFATLPSATRFDTVLQIMVFESQQSFEHVCNSTNEYVNCIGEDNYATCLSPANLNNVIGRLGSTNVYLYSYIAFQTQFECGAGFSSFDENYECYVSTSRNESSAIRSCNTNYDNAKKNDPNNLCLNTNNFLACLTTVYDACGEDFGHIYCQYMLFEYTAIPNCHLTCNSTSTTTITTVGITTSSEETTTKSSIVIAANKLLVLSLGLFFMD